MGLRTKIYHWPLPLPFKVFRTKAQRIKKISRTFRNHKRYSELQDLYKILEEAQWGEGPSLKKLSQKTIALFGKEVPAFYLTHQIMEDLHNDR